MKLLTKPTILSSLNTPQKLCGLTKMGDEVYFLMTDKMHLIRGIDNYQCAGGQRGQSGNQMFTMCLSTKSQL